MNKNGITDACSTADCCPFLSIVANCCPLLSSVPHGHWRHGDQIERVMVTIEKSEQIRSQWGGDEENRCVEWPLLILRGLKCLTAVTRFRLRILRICLLKISLGKVASALFTFTFT